MTERASTLHKIDQKSPVAAGGQKLPTDGKNRTGEIEMANKSAKQALEQFKMEAANEVGVNLQQGYNGDLTARQAGSIGGQMVKKMIESYQNGSKK